jgi:hypothetical protein
MLTKNKIIEKVGKIGKENISLLVTVVELPTKAKETIVNYNELPGKIDYILNAYDDDLILNTCKYIKLLDCIIL